MSPEQLSHLDALFLHIERANTPMHTAGVVIFEGTVPFQRVYETVESRLHLVPRFAQRIIEVPLRLGHPFWAADPNFDLSYHLRHAALPPPGTDEQLCNFAARLISRPLDRSRPLWEVYVVEGLEDGRSALVAKTHHAMVDGLSSMDLATALFDFTEESPAMPPGKIDRPSGLPSWIDLLRLAAGGRAKEMTDVAGALRAAAAAPRRVLEGARSSAVSALSAAASMLRPAPPTTLNVGPGLHRRYAIVRSTLQTFKDVRKAGNATVNDVVLAVCADALGRLFRDRGERTEGRSLRVMVPVSVRDESQGKALGNALAPVFPDLPIGKMKPIDRLRLIHDQMADIKESRQALSADLLVNLTRWAPPTLHSLAARLGSRARLMNTLISNVPGPQIPLYSCGVKMLEPYAVIPLARGQSLAIGVTSYNGGIFFGLNSDRDAMPDLPRLALHIDEAIGDLEKAAAEHSSSRVTHAETEIAVGGAGGDTSAG